MSQAKQLMDEFHAGAQLHKEAGHYGAGMVFDSCENAVNNFLHGRTFAETVRLTHAALTQNAQRPTLDAEERAAYAEAIALLDGFVAQQGA